MIKLGHTGVVYSVTAVVTVAASLGFVACPPPPPITRVEIQITDTVIGGRVTVVVNPDCVTVTRGYCAVVVTLVYGGRTTVQGNLHVTVGLSVFQMEGSICNH